SWPVVSGPMSSAWARTARWTRQPAFSSSAGERERRARMRRPSDYPARFGLAHDENAKPALSWIAASSFSFMLICPAVTDPGLAHDGAAIKLSIHGAIARPLPDPWHPDEGAGRFQIERPPVI